MFRKFLFDILAFPTTVLRITISGITWVVRTGFSIPKKTFHKLILTPTLQQYVAVWGIFRNTVIFKKCKAIENFQLL